MSKSSKNSSSNRKSIASKKERDGKFKDGGERELEEEAKRSLEWERHPFEALEQICKDLKQVREEMKEKRRQEKAYRQTETFRKAGGLLSPMWGMSTLRERERLLKIKKFLLELWKMPLSKMLKELEKIEVRKKLDYFSTFNLREINSVIEEMTGIIQRVYRREDVADLYEALLQYLETHPEDADKTLKPKPQRAKYPESKFKVGDIVARKDDDYKYEVEEIETINYGYSICLRSMETGSLIVHSYTIYDETDPSDYYRLVEDE